MSVNGIPFLSKGSSDLSGDAVRNVCDVMLDKGENSDDIHVTCGGCIGFKVCVQCVHG